MIVKLLTKHHLEFLSLKEATQASLVKMQHCWKSHVTAQISVAFTLQIPDYHERRRGRKPKVDPAFLDVDKLTGEENVSVINRLTGKKVNQQSEDRCTWPTNWLAE